MPGGLSVRLRVRLLTETPDASLWRGDILRLMDNYDLGPGSGPVDLMVFDPMHDGAGLGLVVVSGRKAGNVLSIMPKESCGPMRRSLETSWLIANWDDWFCYTYQRDGERLLPLPIEGTLLIAWDEREIVMKP